MPRRERGWSRRSPAPSRQVERRLRLGNCRSLLVAPRLGTAGLTVMLLELTQPATIS
jgi:hypothetical protein